MQSDQLNILILGYGAREHALGWKVAQSPRVKRLFFAPGNAGTAEIGTNVSLSDEDVGGLLHFALETQIDLTLVGTNDPLALGVVDAFQAAGLKIFGPTQQAARLESSKAFAKAFMQRHHIPTPAFATFTQYEKALAYVARQASGRLVVKIDGLGKMGQGVTVCHSKKEAKAALYTYMIEKSLGEAGHQVIIEQQIEGPELSVFGLSDGKQVVPLTPVRDHKRIYDQDLGPNTGGMGAFGPPEDLSPQFMPFVTETILQPTIDGMAAEGTPYVGVLFAGLMQTAQGLQVLEFNCRFGNPEALVLLSLLESDLVDVIEACLEGALTPDMVRIRPGAAAAIVAASPQYPAAQFPLGMSISGVNCASWLPNVSVFHHGTAVKNNKLITSRGRVLAVTAVGANLQRALSRAYDGMTQIHFEGMHYRRDIGQRPAVSLKTIPSEQTIMSRERPFTSIFY